MDMLTSIIKKRKTKMLVLLETIDGLKFSANPEQVIRVWPLWLDEKECSIVKMIDGAEIKLRTSVDETNKMLNRGRTLLKG